MVPRAKQFVTGCQSATGACDKNRAGRMRQHQHLPIFGCLKVPVSKWILFPWAVTVGLPETRPCVLRAGNSSHSGWIGQHWEANPIISTWDSCQQHSNKHLLITSHRKNAAEVVSEVTGKQREFVTISHYFLSVRKSFGCNKANLQTGTVWKRKYTTIKPILLVNFLFQQVWMEMGLLKNGREGVQRRPQRRREEEEREKRGAPGSPQSPCQGLKEIYKKEEEGFFPRGMGKWF